MSNIKVSVIIVNYNSDKHLVKCLNAIGKHTSCKYEIIVIDNASQTIESEQLQINYPKVNFIFNTQNVGFAKANNQGIDIANGQYVFFLNPDAYLQSDAIAEFLHFMDKEENKFVACCGGNLINHDKVPQVAYGNFPTLREAIFNLGFRRIFPNYFNKHLNTAVKVEGENIPFEVCYVSGANLFVRKSVLDQIGYFDEDFFLYFEETELCFRLKKRGYKSVLLPLVKIVHIEGGSQQYDGQVSQSKYQFFAKSRNLFCLKCYGSLPAKLMRIIYAFHYLIIYALKWDKGPLTFAKITFKG